MKNAKPYLYLLLAVCILAGVGYVSRGIIREKAMPWAVERYRLQDLNHAHQNEYDQLHKPFETLGLYFGELQNPDCNLSQARIFSVTISCVSDVSKPVHMGQSALERYMEQAPKVENEIKQQGWKPWYPERKPGLWYVENGTMHGAVYSKETKGVSCQIQFPNPYEASEMRYFCSQMFTYFGNGDLHGGY